jgi:hypothetical protein
MLPISSSIAPSKEERLAEKALPFVRHALAQT